MNREIILASKSPRRSELLQQIGINFKVIVSDAEESMSDKLLPELNVINIASEKALNVASRCNGEIVIAADTIVVCDDNILGKPKDYADAKNMLLKLSNREHKVMTGLCLVDTKNNDIWRWVEVTRVFFRELSEQDIDNYLATLEYEDKAGGYGIQGFGALLVEKIDGCYFNVVGLPLSALAVGLKKMGVNAYGYGK